ncbi:shikimate dehydrogenase family protein [Psychroflexus planctonicus]|uniref:Shikimate 5-dehydrogenase n=1 Tax=Psychroflexus planctonicus TaxID=1526575 RepID=A0ABQ1SN48_9FLAO|nr:shikimate dehydrogenase [Psychroflexus planctonicus]GGE44785.1 shikimate 5-dehydrogenase [Psychroflexus planctonicus]
MRKFGLLGKNIDYSFSKRFFRDYFHKNNIRADYTNFDVEKIPALSQLMLANPGLEGFNVTTPFKEAIIEHLDELDETAKRIKAVNTVKIKNGKFIGYNTDAYGFIRSIFPLIENHHEQALVLGTGGAAKAVTSALKSMSIATTFVSRKPKNAGEIAYADLNENIIQKHYLIVNCSPVGTVPNETKCPDIPYTFLGKKHFLYDLVYNPPLTKFLALGKQKGAKTANGLKMLELQALRAWEIWNEEE